MCLFLFFVGLGKFSREVSFCLRDLCVCLYFMLGEFPCFPLVSEQCKKTFTVALTKPSSCVAPSHSAIFCYCGNFESLRTSPW